MPPTDPSIQSLVDELIEIDAQLARLKARKDEIEKSLEAWGLAHPELAQPLADETREGRRVFATSSSGKRLPIVFSSDELISSFKSHSPKHSELLKVLDVQSLIDGSVSVILLTKFFALPTKHERVERDGNKFRQLVFANLSPHVAAAFLAACRATDKNGIPKSKTIIDLTQLSS